VPPHRRPDGDGEERDPGAVGDPRRPGTERAQPVGGEELALREDDEGFAAGVLDGAADLVGADGPEPAEEGEAVEGGALDDDSRAATEAAEGEAGGEAVPPRVVVRRPHEAAGGDLPADEDPAHPGADEPAGDEVAEKFADAREAPDRHTAHAGSRLPVATVIPPATRRFVTRKKTASSTGSPATASPVVKRSEIDQIPSPMAMASATHR